VVLYKNGVGYFEHSTRVRGTQDLNIDFTSAELNDALKSLTVVDLGDGRITGVRFNSVAPLSERLKTLSHRRPRTRRRGEPLPQPDRLRQGGEPAAAHHLRRGRGRSRNLRQHISEVPVRMTPALQQAIKRVLDQKGVIDSLDEQIKTRKNEEQSIAADQGRIRENMMALKGSPEEKALLRRYTGQLNQQEDRLAALRSQLADLTARRQQASDQLDKILGEIALDEKF